MSKKQNHEEEKKRQTLLKQAQEKWQKERAEEWTVYLIHNLYNIKTIVIRSYANSPFGLLECHPVDEKKFGSKILIPHTNIRAITKGKSFCKENITIGDTK